MKNRLLKTTSILVLTIILVAVAFSRADKDTTDSVDELFPLKDGELIIYETEVDSKQDCTNQEEYDAQRSVCFFECETEVECRKIEELVNKELDELGDEYISTAKDFSENVPKQETYVAAKYSVSEGEKIVLVQGKSDKKYEAAWNLFARISPDQITDAYVEAFEAVEDPNDDTLAYVHDEDGNKKWVVGVNFATYGQEGKREDILTLVHEFTHILTLKSDQLDKDSTGCQTYDTGNGCARDGSYLFSFVKAFWPEADRKVAASQVNLYNQKPNSFLTEYAATNPEEDIAESFALFVLEKESGERAKNVAEGKRKFFFQYPELRDMRLEIRKSLGEIILERKRLGS